MLKFNILNRFSGEVQVTAEIDCAEDALPSVKLGLAVKWAVKHGARLDGASLDGASLDGASLVRARLDNIRNDLWDVLIRAPAEVPGLLAALRGGRVDGTVYQGECACLVGTIANIRHANYGSLGHGLTPDNDRPIERWFYGIAKGDTPETNPIAKITEGWIVEFQELTALAAPASPEAAA